MSKVKWRIEKLTGGRKTVKKEYEYEVQFVGMTYNSNRTSPPPSSPSGASTST